VIPWLLPTPSSLPSPIFGVLSCRVFFSLSVCLCFCWYNFVRLCVWERESSCQLVGFRGLAPEFC
jgi:hypothetical protein